MEEVRHKIVPVICVELKRVTYILQLYPIGDRVWVFLLWVSVAVMTYFDQENVDEATYDHFSAWAWESCSSHLLGTWMPCDKVQTNSKKSPEIYLGPFTWWSTKLSWRMTEAACVTQGETNSRAEPRPNRLPKELWANKINGCCFKKPCFGVVCCNMKITDTVYDFMYMKFKIRRIHRDSGQTAVIFGGVLSGRGLRKPPGNVLFIELVDGHTSLFIW